jgi:hypothetical protein
MRINKFNIAVLTLLAGVCAVAQAPPPLMGPADLDRLVQRVALYPDSLLAQVMAAATYSDQIPEADQWANQHAALHGDALAHAIEEDHLPWDASVQALAWTQQLGNAFLAQRNDVMDAVQRDRRAAERFGYLRTNGYYSVVNAGGFIEINPVVAGVFVVPVYNPAVVFYAPRPGFAIGAAISFGPRIALGVSFAPWGWGPGPWGRTWVNRGTYVHPSALPHYEPARRVESHRVPPPRRIEERRGRP